MAAWSADLEDEDDLPAVAWPRVGAELFLDAQLPPGEVGAAAAHVARARFDRATAPHRQRVRELRDDLVRFASEPVPAEVAASRLLDPLQHDAARRALEDTARRAARGALEAQRAGTARAGEWLRAVGAGEHPDGGPSVDERRALATRLLDATDDATRSLADRYRIDRASRWIPALHTERSLFRPERRFQRIAADIEALGLRPALAARVHTHRAMPAAFRPRIALRRAHDIQLAGPGIDGVPGELFAAEGLGRALALALVTDRPAPLRRPVAGSVSRAFGALLMQVATDPIALRRRGLTRSEAEGAHRVAIVVQLLVARLCAAGTLEATTVAERARLVGRALGADTEPGSGFVLASSVWGPRFRGAVSGLALFGALRDHYDEDWFRNPRAAEALRNAAGPGGSMSIETFLGELSVAPDVAIGRLGELLERA